MTSSSETMESAAREGAVLRFPSCMRQGIDRFHPVTPALDLTDRSVFFFFGLGILIFFLYPGL